MLRDFSTSGLDRLMRFDHLACENGKRARRHGRNRLGYAFVDLTITVASVVTDANPKFAYGFAGETILQGQSVYLAASGLWMKAQCDGTAIQAGSGGEGNFGIATNAALVNQTIAVQYRGKLTAGATLTVGVQYCISDTFGGICPQSAVPSGSLITVLGIASTAALLDMTYAKYTGLTVP